MHAPRRHDPWAYEWKWPKRVMGAEGRLGLLYMGMFEFRYARGFIWDGLGATGVCCAGFFRLAPRQSVKGKKKQKHEAGLSKPEHEATHYLYLSLSPAPLLLLSPLSPPPSRHTHLLPLCSIPGSPFVFLFFVLFARVSRVFFNYYSLNYFPPWFTSLLDPLVRLHRRSRSRTTTPPITTLQLVWLLPTTVLIPHNHLLPLLACRGTQKVTLPGYQNVLLPLHLHQQCTPLSAYQIQILNQIQTQSILHTLAAANQLLVLYASSVSTASIHQWKRQNQDAEESLPQGWLPLLGLGLEQLLHLCLQTTRQHIPIPIIHPYAFPSPSLTQKISTLDV